MNDKKWVYLCLMRPPMPGAIPKDGLDGVDFKEGYSLSGHHYWGHAIYNRKLTDEEVLHYDLEETALNNVVRVLQMDQVRQRRLRKPDV